MFWWPQKLCPKYPKWSKFQYQTNKRRQQLSVNAKTTHHGNLAYSQYQDFDNPTLLVIHSCVKSVTSPQSRLLQPKRHIMLTQASPGGFAQRSGHAVK